MSQGMSSRRSRRLAGTGQQEEGKGQEPIIEGSVQDDSGEGERSPIQDPSPAEGERLDAYANALMKIMGEQQRMFAEALGLNRTGTLGLVSGSPRSSSQSNSSNTVLYGENYRQTLGSFPTLKLNNKMEYVTWVSQVHLTLSGLGLGKLVTSALEESFNQAVRMESGRRSISEIFTAWKRVHSKACVSLQQSIQSVFGMNLLNSIRSKQMEIGDTQIQVGECNTSGYYKLINEETFVYENAFYFWKLIESSITFSMYEAGNLLIKFVTQKYVYRSDPVKFKANFELMRDLLSTIMLIPDTMLKMIWFTAIPPECESLRQGLSARGDNLTWVDIYEGILENYHQNNKQPKTSTNRELGLLTTTSTRHYKGKNSSYRNGTRSTEKCKHCERIGHNDKVCWVAHPELKPSKLAQNSSKRSRSTSEPEEFQAPAIEIDPVIMGMGELGLDGEIIMKVRERPSQTFFIFDSAATSHMVNELSLLSDTRTVPSVIVSSAIRGHTTSITTRGTLMLNEQWKLTEVAYVKNGSANLISEGRLCDAGFTVTKDKESIRILTSTGKVVLQGYRYNRLWVFGINGARPTPLAINTLLRLSTTDRRVSFAPKTPSIEEEKEEDEPSPPQVDIDLATRCTSSSSNAQNKRGSIPKKRNG
jgi:hypothetical protein